MLSTRLTRHTAASGGEVKPLGISGKLVWFNRNFFLRKSQRQNYKENTQSKLFNCYYLKSVLFMNKFHWTHHVEYERNVCAVWLRDEFKKWSYEISAALASQKSWVWIPLKTPEIFQVHTYKTIAEIVQQVRGSLIFLNSYAEYVDQNEIHDVNLLCFLTAFVTVLML